MTTTINAQATTGLLTTADGSGIVKLQSNGVTTNALGWCNFSVSGSTPTIQSSYNMASITYNGTGDFTGTLTTAAGSASIVAGGFARITGQGGVFAGVYDPPFTSSTFRFGTWGVGGSWGNPTFATFTIHGQ